MHGHVSQFASSHVSHMREALTEAQEAAQAGEVPVGAIVVWNGQIIGKGHNRRETRQSPLAHAEILAIEEAAAFLRSWRLTECDLYVTFEPCIMCVGAILQARMRHLLFGCRDPKAGAAESLYRLCDDPRLNHRLPVTGGVSAHECGALLEKFFGDLSRRKKQTRNAERWPSPAEGA